MLGLLELAILIAGGVPKPGQEWLEKRISFWNARWASLASAVLEVILAAGLLQSFLIRVGIENGMPDGGVVRLVVATFLAIEGLLRIAIVTQGSAVASLPVLVVWRVVGAIVQPRRSSRAR